MRGRWPAEAETRHTADLQIGLAGFAPSLINGPTHLLPGDEESLGGRQDEGEIAIGPSDDRGYRAPIVGGMITSAISHPRLPDGRRGGSLLLRRSRAKAGDIQPVLTLTEALLFGPRTSVSVWTATWLERRLCNC